MKKVLSLVLVLAMVLGTFSFAFAASSDNVTELVSDIDNDEVVKAVERLSAFGIVNGMEDGKYHPELETTREQFAKVVIEALALGDVADAASGASKFTDVENNRWSVGYINVAADQGLVKGMGDGTFHPTDKITYAQAATLLVRALGYRDEFLPGDWPGNYLAKASEVGILDGVKVSPSGFVNRGDLALMVNNTLDAEIIKIKSYTANNPEYEETEITLLEDRLELDKVEDLRVVEIPELNGNLESDELKVIALKDDVKIDNKYYDKYDAEDNDKLIKVYFDEDSVDPKDLLGMEITGYFDEDKLVYAEVETDPDDVFRCIAYDDEGDGTMIIWDAPIDYYDWDSSAVVYINGERVEPDITSKGKWKESWDVFTEYSDSDVSYAFAKRIVVEGDEIVFADIAVPEEVNLIVTDVDESKERIEYVLSYNYDIDYADIDNTVDLDTDLELDLDDYDAYDIFAQDGTELELSDIEKYNVLYYYEDEIDDNILHILVADPEQTVTGELEKVKIGRVNSGFTRSRVFIDGDGYSVASRFAYTDDDLDSAKGVHRYSSLDDIWDDSFGEEVSVYLDFKGRVAFMITDTETANDDYGVIIGTDDSYGDETVKLWTMDGVKDVYDFDSDSDVDFDELEKGSIVKYSLNAAGDEVEIEKVWNIKESHGVYYLNEVKEDNVLPTLDTKDTFEDDAIRVVGADYSKYYNESGSVYLNYADYLEEDYDDSELEVVKWADLDETNADSGCYVLIITDEDHEKDVDLMVFVNNYDSISDEDKYVGYIVERQMSSDEMTLTVDVSGEGIKEYVLDDEDDAFDEIDYAETFIVFRERGEDGLKLDAFGDEINVKTDYELIGHVLDYNNVDGFAWVIDRDGRDLTVAVGDLDGDDFSFSEKTYKISKDAPVYYDDEKASYTDLDFGYAIEFVVEDEEIVALKYWEDEDIEGCATELTGDDDEYALATDPKGEDEDEDEEIEVEPNTAVLTTLSTDANYGRTVTASVYVDIDLDDKAEFDVEVDRSKIAIPISEAEKIGVRNISGIEFNEEDSTVTFTVVFNDDVFVGDTLKISKDAIKVNEVSAPAEDVSIEIK